MISSLEWRISADTGGTFTDCWAIDPRGREKRIKVLSTGTLRSRAVAPNPATPRAIVIEDHWDTRDEFFRGFTLRVLSGAACSFESEIMGWNAGARELRLGCPVPHTIAAGALVELTAHEEAPVLGARLLTQTALDQCFPPLRFRLASTRATNALLERKGEPVLLLITRGFGDLLRICDQRRPDLFALKHCLPDPLYAEVIEIPERLDAFGNVIVPLEITPVLIAELVAIRGRGIRAAAIALLHSYRNPSHEKQLAETLTAAGFEHVSLSSALAPLIKILPRAQTAVVDACLSPIMRTFFDRVATPLLGDARAGGPEPLSIMTSAGGLEPRTTCRAKDTLLSGPAGGVVGAAAIARACGFERVISFDMGGTSTDAARFDGDYLYRFEQRIGDARLLSPALRIETVAAGGGSICRFDKVAGLKVGPESAGSDPGPACYGKGGPLTITDVNLLLGRIDSARVTIPFDDAASETAFVELLDSMEVTAEVDGNGSANARRREEILSGLLEIAVERTADAIRAVSLREGVAPEEFALAAFGGAGPLHACAVAEKLGITTILVPGDAGLLSAFGVHCAVQERFAEKQILRPLAPFLPSLPGEIDALAALATGRLAEAGADPGEIRIKRKIAELRLSGQDAALAIDLDEDAARLPRRFTELYHTIYGHPPPAEKAIELVSLRVVASAGAPAIPSEEFPCDRDETCAALSSAPAGPAFCDRTGLRPGDRLRGPLIVQDDYSTLLIASGWEGRVGSRLTIKLQRTPSPPPAANASGPPSQPSHASIESELFRHRFENIVDEMGARLQRSALSTNIRERADFSCALLDADGRLVVNAPHIPVHLGALGLCVRELMRRHRLERGDMLVTNHPAFGGSHLPDVTVVSPVFAPGSRDAIAYVANRAHHAEIGGVTPGSMPPAAKSLAEEGVVIPPAYLFRNGHPNHGEVRELLTSRAPYPTRSLEDNLADLNAQAAANLHGVRALEALAAAHGPGAIQHHLRELSSRARQALAFALRDRPLPAPVTSGEELDDGTPIFLTLTPMDGGLEFDFTGTALIHPGNLNATPAIVRSAVLYALRLFTRSDLPLNEGLLDNVSITLPRCFLNPVFHEDPARCPAVVGGNVETSQRLVDTILKALHLQACSQGTMNNLLFGSDAFGYYETIAGGAGAGPGYDGASAIHTHMTNTAITDPEILEQRFPVRLREFSVRRGSGGNGRFRGGDGVIRELEFLAPLTLSLLTQHRVQKPYGLDGGSPGACGHQILILPGDGEIKLASSAQVEVAPGTRLRIETPGGGGWGGRSRDR